MIELFNLWSVRDRRYATRKFMGAFAALTEREVEAVTAWRKIEIDMLPAEDQELARVALRQWSPPTHIKH